VRQFTQVSRRPDRTRVHPLTSAMLCSGYRQHMSDAISSAL
jgi:hypothetical protein